MRHFPTIAILLAGLCVMTAHAQNGPDSTPSLAALNALAGTPKISVEMRPGNPKYWLTSETQGGFQMRMTYQPGDVKYFGATNFADGTNVLAKLNADHAAPATAMYHATPSVTTDEDVDETDFRTFISNYPWRAKGDPPITDADFNAKKAALIAFIKTHRAKSFSTFLLPPVIHTVGSKATPLLAKSDIFDPTTFGFKLNPAAVVDRATTPKGYKAFRFSSDPGNWYRFAMQGTIYAQTLPNNAPTAGTANRLNASGPSLDGISVTLPVPPNTWPADLTTGFVDSALKTGGKYTALPLAINSKPDSFDLDDLSNVLTSPYGPDGNTAFDPGHLDVKRQTTQTAQAEMQIFVDVQASVYSGNSAAATDSAAAVTYRVLDEDLLYVEDYIAFVPATAADANNLVSSQTPPDLTGATPDADVTPAMDNFNAANPPDISNPNVRAPRYFPDPVKDETLLTNVNGDMDNPNDLKSSSNREIQLNFEIGRGIGDRYVYSAKGAALQPGQDPDTAWGADVRYIIYVPPYEVTNKDGSQTLIGPYAGPALDTGEGASGSLDPYRPTGPWRSGYQPIVLGGNVLKAVNYLYDVLSGTSPDLPKDVEPIAYLRQIYGKDTSTLAQLGYKYAAGIAYKYNAECIVGPMAQQVGNTMTVPPGIIPMPQHFQSFKGVDKNGHHLNASPDADLKDTGSLYTAQNGGPGETPDHYRDSVFVAKAEDCCGNAVNLASATYAVGAAQKPNVVIALQDPQTNREEAVGVPTALNTGVSTYTQSDKDKVSSRIGTDYKNGNWINDNPTLDGTASLDPAAGSANPPDRDGKSFLVPQEEYVVGHRYIIQACGDSPVGPASNPPKYFVNQMTVEIIAPDSTAPEKAFQIVGPESGGSTAPCGSFDYVFRQAATAANPYKIRTTIVDMNGSTRQIIVPVEVKGEGQSIDKINSESEKK